VIEQLFDRYRDVAAALERPLTLADIGARWRPNERWRELTPPVEIVGFEGTTAKPSDSPRRKLPRPFGTSPLHSVPARARRRST
jgi:hypothetical protein